MTPLAVFYNALCFFEHGGFCYSFKVPDGKSMDSFISKLRTHARQRGYKWRVAYWGEGRTWLIKQKKGV